MNHSTVRRSLLRSTLGAGCALAGFSARAADTGKMLFGFQADSVTANIGRGLLKEIHGHYQPDLGVDLTYVSGGSGERCLNALRKAPPDGATALFMPSPPLTLLPQAQTLTSADVLGELIAVGSIAEYTCAFTVGPAVPAEVRTMQDWVRWISANPSQGSYGIPGTGLGQHFVGMSLARRADLTLTPVAYQGHVPLIKDLLNGAVPSAVLILGSARQAHLDGRLRALAVTSRERWPAMPDLPTLREMGLSDVDMTATLGVHLLAGTPGNKVAELDAAIQYALGSPGLNALLKESLMLPAPGTPVTYAQTLAHERSTWTAVVKRERFSMKD